MCKNLHQELFSTLAPESEQELNEKICKQISSFRFFVTPTMLELPANRVAEERVQQAVQLLDQLDNMKTPKGKLNLVINFAKVVSLML